MKKILIIDDDHVEIFICERLFKFVAPEIKTNYFTSPEAAISYLIEFKHEIKELNIILDISMPDMTGWDFLDECIKHEIFCDVFILSSSINPIDKLKADDHLLVKGYYSKPIVPENIVQIINM